MVASLKERGHRAPEHIVCQWVDHPKPSDPYWKRWVHRHVWLNIARFFFNILDFQRPARKLPDGSFLFLQQQGIEPDLWRAEQAASMYPGGFVVEDVPVGSMLPAGPVKLRQVHPHSAVPIQGGDTTPVPNATLAQLAAKIKETQPSIDANRSLLV